MVEVPPDRAVSFGLGPFFFFFFFGPGGFLFFFFFFFPVFFGNFSEGRAKVWARIERLIAAIPWYVKPVGAGVSELAEFN